MSISIRHGAAAWVAALLAGCGGGSDSSPPAATSITVAGTAVKGAALAGAAVSVKCASGTASATTAGDGAYSVTLSGAGLPCAIKVTGSAGEVFHSVVPGTGAGGTVTANLTPLTEWVVAQLAGMAPAAYFDSFGSASTVSAAALTQAIAYVKSAVAGVTDLGSINPVTDALAVGDAMDRKIDAVVAALAAAGLSLPAVTAAIVANPSAPSVVAAPLAPAASDCAWLKSGRYRVLGTEDADANVAVIDAATLSGTGPDGEPFVMTSDGGCRYTIDEPDYTTTLMVSSSGVVIVHGQSKVNAEHNLSIALPEQTLPLSEWAGTWNAVSWEPASASSGSIATVHEGTIDGSGQFTALSDCLGLAACVPQSGALSRLVVNASSGGFDEILPSGATWARAFLFKALSGKTVAVFITPEVQFIVATRKEPIAALPAVGAVTTFRQFQVNGNGTIDAVTQDTNTVTAVDAASKRVTRRRSSDNRVDTLGYDQPRDGLRYRAPNSCTRNGVPASCAEVVQLPLQDMGITFSASVGSNPATAFLNASIGRP